jgi:hypothetical protein
MTWFLADVGVLFLSIVFVGLRGGWEWGIGMGTCWVHLIILI